MRHCAQQNEISSFNDRSTYAVSSRGSEISKYEKSKANLKLSLKEEKWRNSFNKRDYSLAKAPQRIAPIIKIKNDFISMILKAKTEEKICFL